MRTLPAATRACHLLLRIVCGAAARGVASRKALTTARRVATMCKWSHVMVRAFFFADDEPNSRHAEGCADFVSCLPCTANIACGWCLDDGIQLCVSGGENAPSAARSCRAGYFYDECPSTCFNLYFHLLCVIRTSIII